MLNQYLMYSLKLSFEKGMQNPDSKIMYTEFNREFENFGKWVRIVVFYGSLGVTTICYIIMTYVNYYILDLKDESFVLTSPVMYVSSMMSVALSNSWIQRKHSIFSLSILRVRLPFNWKTPLGYLVVQLSEAMSFLSIVSCLISTLCFYAGSCWLIIAFGKDIANDLDLLNVGGASNRNRKLTRERFGKIIQIHMDVKQLSCI